MSSPYSVLGHLRLISKRDYEDEAQCDSDLSPSPLLKHYRFIVIHAQSDRQKLQRGVSHRGRVGNLHRNRTAPGVASPPWSMVADCDRRAL